MTKVDSRGYRLWPCFRLYFGTVVAIDFAHLTDCILELFLAVDFAHVTDCILELLWLSQQPKTVPRYSL
jgi:hypothetical protein